MKKTLLTILVCATAIATAGAQKFPSDEKPWRGQAEVQIHPSTLLSVNGIAYYKAAHSVYIGAGGGLLLGFQEFSIAERLFARLKFENSSLKISPFFSIDAGIITSIPAAFRSWTAIPEISTQLGLRFRLKNGDNLSCSIGMNAMIINSYIIPVIALPALSIGYTF